MFYNFIKISTLRIININKDESILMESKGNDRSKLELMKPYTASNLKDIETSYDCKYIQMFIKGYGQQIKLNLHYIRVSSKPFIYEWFL